jgi:CubicO group peptidase (beta-lactamase class C family)
MRSGRLLGSFALLAVGVCALEAQTPAGVAAPSRRDAAQIERLLRPGIRIAGRPDTAFDIADRMRYWHVPGVSLAIVDDFKIVYAKGFGVAEFGGSTRVDTTTLFLAGSISKPVFATGAVRLVQQGKLALDEDVNAKLKSWRVPDSRFTEREKVTLRRLLSHSAGLTVWGFPGYAADSSVPTVPQLLDGARPANTAAVRNDTFPGARWLYSGGGITIAQLLATDVTGEAFPALMKRLVLAPAGMTRSTFENPLPVARHREAASGHERVDTPVPGRFHTYPEMAAAGLWTTAADLARWEIALARAYNGESNAILSPEMARQMVSKQMVIGQQFGGGAYGLGVGVEGEGDSVAFSHGGRDEGFVASVMMWPKLGRGYVILTNGVSGALLAEIRRGFAEMYGVSAAPARPERRVSEADSASLGAFVGQYVLVQGRDTLINDVTQAGRELTMYNRSAKRQIPLWFEEPDIFFDPNTGNTFVFERDTPGTTVKAMRLGRGPNGSRAVRK